ncbi:MAG: EamA family transporter [Xanthomonadales bacterium]|nr:EamA family transporter [Gammaproteobacteria bacterium]NNE05409.1 EamA family transporter [Xanthomonadales bacterium]NNL95079.1 EamA family transporter [Xanthomonadales bacterium]
MNNLALYATSVLVWGSTWLIINYQLGEVAPEVSVVYRYAIAAALLFAWMLARGLQIRYSLHAHMRFFMLGLLLFSFNYIATYSAQQYIPSALNAVAFSSMMWMNVINSRVFFGTRIEPRLWFGALLGLAGIITLFWPQISHISLTDKVLLGGALSLSGAFLASLGNMMSKSSQQSGLPIIQANAWGMLYGTLITAAVAWRRDIPFNFDFSFPYVSSLLYLSVFGSIVAFGAYLKLVGRIGPHKAGYVVVMFPVVAVVLSLMFEGISITVTDICGISLVLAGNLAVLGKWRYGPRIRAWLDHQKHYWLDRKVVVSKCTPRISAGVRHSLSHVSDHSLHRS